MRKKVWISAKSATFRLSVVLLKTAKNNCLNCKGVYLFPFLNFVLIFLNLLLFNSQFLWVEYFKLVIGSEAQWHIGMSSATYAWSAAVQGSIPGKRGHFLRPIGNHIRIGIFGTILDSKSNLQRTYRDEGHDIDVPKMFRPIKFC